MLCMCHSPSLSFSPPLGAPACLRVSVCMTLLCSLMAPDYCWLSTPASHQPHQAPVYLPQSLSVFALPNLVLFCSRIIFTGQPPYQLACSPSTIPSALPTNHATPSSPHPLQPLPNTPCPLPQPTISFFISTSTPLNLIYIPLMLFLTWVWVFFDKS